jgi:sec-independent protein translocase protein TatB
VFDGVGWAEVLILLLIGLFVFGPEKLPKAARDAGRVLRQLRQMAAGVRNDIRSELGPEFADFDVRTLHPKTFVRKHLLDEEEPLFPSYLNKRGSVGSALFDDLDDPPSLTKGVGLTTKPSAVSLTKPPTSAAKASLAKATAVKGGHVPAQPERAGVGSATLYDDAT